MTNFNKKLLSILALALCIFNFSQAQLVHPGISHKLSDLDRMKAMVEAGVEPWATTYQNLSNNSKAQYNYSVNVDPAITTEYNSTSDGWFINDGTAAYYNALMWYITGDSRHAEKAIEIFNTWKGLKRNTMTVPLSSGRIWRIIEAAEIIQHTYDGWVETDIQEFKDMLVYPGYSNTTVPTSAIASNDITFYWRVYQGDPARHGNQGLFCMRTMMAMAIFLDNEIMYDRALRYLQGYTHRVDDVAYPSGPPINNNQLEGCEYFDEFTQNGFETTITDYGYNEVISNYIYENGQCQESSRDQAHGLAGVSTIAVMAEMAWSQGDDLYGHLNNRPLLGLEFYYRYNLSYDNSYPDQSTPWEPTVASGEYIERSDRSGRWTSLKINPYLVCNTGEEYRERAKHNLQPVYEMNLAHYRDRLQTLPSDDYKWLQRGFEYLTTQIGVEGEGTVTDHPGFGGLKFRRVSPGDPISGFDSNGLPMYKMNDLSTVIEAENFDYFVLNGQDRTYSDNSNSNEGGEYRTDEAVDLEVCSEGGYCVTNIEGGEWLTYTINVPANGIYSIGIRYASENSNGKIKFNLDGEDVTSEVEVPFGGANSTGLTDWKDYEVANQVHLNQGVQAMKVLFGGANNAFQLNNINVSLVEADQDPVNLAVLYGIASQSIDSDPCPYGGCAELAIDGNTNGNFGGGSVSHSAHGTTDSLKWWKVDLQNNYNIETINIYNRTGGYESRLSDITLEIKDSNNNVVYSEFFAGYPNPMWSIDIGGVKGKEVTISKTTDTGITLAEVEVYGVDAPVTLSKNNFEFKNNIKLYPNPANNLLYVTNAENSKISIYNILGTKVRQKDVIKNNEYIDLSGLKNGMYFVKISKDGTNSTQRIIKQ
ncbi:carbohydrate-binding protein [Neotamlana laminarinivorans]|uniref:Carbohydrate-binding protein n=1 Tax=Neotamlana laminarinivorans TaxID=2883124 RepID=A0A9X1L2B3_9FLAO|nr:carbohydrate-binding protein [Tamlana laminarinivorans]MCB4799650.1 carbohydrate-binding protein [Tamlana laminarinivorans]